MKRQDALDEFTQSFVAVEDYLHNLDTNHAVNAAQRQVPADVPAAPSERQGRG